MRRLLLLLTIAPLAVAACGATGSAQTASSPSPTCSPAAARSPRPAGSPPAGFVPGQGAFGGLGRPLATGPVDSFGSGVMTVTDRRTGQVVKVTVDSSTQVTAGLGRGAAGSPAPTTQAPAKIAKGETVTVFGVQNADGSITASRVLVMPANAGSACGRGAPAAPRQG